MGVEPGPVALEYTRAIARGDYDAAVLLVSPNRQGILEALALGQGPGTLPTVSGDVSVGEVVESGDSATVSVLGKMCRTETARNEVTLASDCIENHDRKTDSPLFLVHLSRGKSPGWKVVFNLAVSGSKG